MEEQKEIVLLHCVCVCVDGLSGNHRVVTVYQTCQYLFSPTVQTVARFA